MAGTHAQSQCQHCLGSRDGYRRGRCAHRAFSRHVLIHCRHFPVQYQKVYQPVLSHFRINAQGRGKAPSPASHTFRTRTKRLSIPMKLLRMSRMKMISSWVMVMTEIWRLEIAQSRGANHQAGTETLPQNLCSDALTQQSLTFKNTKRVAASARSSTSKMKTLPW